MHKDTIESFSRKLANGEMTLMEAALAEANETKRYRDVCIAREKESIANAKVYEKAPNINGI